MKDQVVYYPMWVSKPLKKAECDNCGRKAWVRVIVVRKFVPEFGNPEERAVAHLCFRCADKETVEQWIEHLKKLDG